MANEPATDGVVQSDNVVINQDDAGGDKSQPESRKSMTSVAGDETERHTEQGVGDGNPEPEVSSHRDPGEDDDDAELKSIIDGEDGVEVPDEHGLTAGAAELVKELDKIKVEPPKMARQESDELDVSEYPESYKENLPKEKLVLAFADNFRRQYVQLYRDRKPLFLEPVNECGIEKFVCTTIRPTQLAYKELYDWDGAAEFVADYLNYAALSPAHELPTRLLSPTTTLKLQRGNCFEYSTVLCSLLIAAGYDAYCVSGYACRETCLMDESREICPLLKKKNEQKQAAERKEQKKYTVKPPKDLRSKFELKMAARKVAAEEEEQKNSQREQEERQLELEKPAPDDLHGLRVHSWVLILSGKREVPESFFIEPTTGIAHSVSSDNYLGIESVWNHQNYWVCMQDCSTGVKNVRYDLGDCALWEYMFPLDDKPKLLLPEEELDDFEDNDEIDNKDDTKNKKTLDIPPSWVGPIVITPREFQMRCPKGKKTKLYKRAKLEKFANYLMKDGLVSRLSVYEDRELTDLKQAREYYSNRVDKLQERVHNHKNGWITEYYLPGRSKCLKEHQYKASAPGAENERVMIFYDEARVDGLQKRIETPTSMTEHFLKREDFLYYRNVEFGRRPKKFGPAESQTPRPIIKMTEKYHHNPNKVANEDIAELVFLCSEERILVTYHTEDNKVSSSTREFTKPNNADEKGAIIVWDPENHITFQVDIHTKDKKKVELYQMMCDLVAAEEACKERVRHSEQEVQNILLDRSRQEAASELEISVYDTERNEKAKKHRAELERLQAEEKKRRQEMELDYLAPFLAQAGDPDKITHKLAYQLKEECLADLKQRLIDKANLIQARFEKETQELQKKQAWYQQNQVSMQKDDEEEYLNYCSEAMFRIHILELRLNRHKDIAPQKYMELEKRIRSDPRLSDFF